jgi:hypothetical protein
MLFTDALEFIRLDDRSPPRIMLDDHTKRVLDRVERSEIFVLDPTAVAMSVNVFLSRPSSILASLPFVRLPAPEIWIEYANSDVSVALARQGNENSWFEGGVRIARTGFLLWQDGDLIRMEAIVKHADGVCEALLPVGKFDVGKDFSLRDEDVAEGTDSDGSTGRMRTRNAMIARNEGERRAETELRKRFGTTLNIHVGLMSGQLERYTGQGSVARQYPMHASDMYRHFSTQILPALILLNCRNAIETEHVPAPSKLNLKREKRGRPAIPAYRMVKLHLTPRKRRIYEQSGRTRAQTESAFVMGHFKVRKTGVWWWRPFVRNLPAGAGPVPKKVRVVTE